MPMSKANRINSIDNNRTNMKRKSLFTIALLLMAALQGFAQQSEEPMQFVFRVGKNQFWLQNNEAEIERMLDCAAKYREEIRGGHMFVYVNGWCDSLPDPRRNLQIARIRSNRVKSELITRRGLKEEYFITANRAASYRGYRNVVVVSFRPLDLVETPEEKPEGPKRPVAEPQPTEAPRPIVEVPVEPQPVAEPQPVEEPIREEVPAVVEEKPAASACPLSLRANLLYWAAGTPNLGFEWRVGNSAVIIVNGAFSHWIWNDRNRQHRTWMVQPELRRYMGDARRWFAGIEIHAGEFNFKFGGKGHQGNLIGGGVTGGYRLELSRIFDLDFSLGLGYTRISKYETYHKEGDAMIRLERKDDKNFWGPTQAGVSLIWKF